MRNKEEYITDIRTYYHTMDRFIVALEDAKHSAIKKAKELNLDFQVEYKDLTMYLVEGYEGEQYFKVHLNRPETEEEEAERIRVEKEYRKAQEQKDIEAYQRVVNKYANNIKQEDKKMLLDIQKEFLE